MWADVEAVAVDDALQVGFAVEAAAAQCLERVSPSFHVGFADESVRAFRVPVADGERAVPVVEYRVCKITG